MTTLTILATVDRIVEVVVAAAIDAETTITTVTTAMANVVAHTNQGTEYEEHHESTSDDGMAVDISVANC